ncbi:helix-turn-helix domain-containing protein [Streptomyces sp. NPDC020379]|uniref:helix-turn-helix domain-containing protein n=1 Tax=Streptomyces sp. NPDC020379 TaxID=3365071 RepID=UPI0037AC70D0
MASRPAPTARRLRLGAELRRLRERAGLSATEASRVLGASQAQISNVEVARFGVSAERIRSWARHYDCSDEELIEGLVSMAGERKRGWWEEYREILASSLLDLAEMEHHAVRIRTAYTAHIPGLLQTAEHAREVFRNGVTELSPPEVEHRVAYRIRRQVILYRDTPTPYTTIIHEAALRMKFGGPEVTRRQLEHVLELSEQEHITVLVIPFDAGAYPGSAQSICYAHGPVPQLDTVHLDQSHGSVLLDAEAQLNKYRVLLDRMEAIALKESESRDFIHNIAQQL